MTVRYPDLADYLAVAAAVTGLEIKVVSASTNLNLADSALHAPRAGFGDEDFYPDFREKAAVLLVRLIKNHPLIDGNKRAAWVTFRLFIEINDWVWSAYPTVDDAESFVVAIASGAINEEQVREWLRGRVAPAAST